MHGHEAGNCPPFSNSKSRNQLSHDVTVPFQWLKTNPRFSDTLVPTNFDI